MADCSKTDVYISESKRMCDYYSDTNSGECCEDCPFYPSFCLTTPNMKPEHAKEAINRVQSWSDEHPEPKSKTYADDFFEKHPNAPKTGEEQTPMVCRRRVYGGDCCADLYKSNKDEFLCKDRSLLRIACWKEPYEEGEND